MTKSIAVLKNVHLGKDIYLIGAGSSLDFLKSSFFEDKITVGVNNVWKKFKLCYNFHFHERWLKESYAAGNILVVSEKECADNDSPQIDMDWCNNFYYYKHSSWRKDTNKITENLEKISKRDTNWLYSCSTVMASALHFCAHLGAKNIILVGVDGGAIDGRYYFRGYNTPEFVDEWIKFYGSEEKLLKYLSEDSLKKEDELLSAVAVIAEFYHCNIYSINPFIGFGLEGYKFSKNLEKVEGLL